MKRYLKTLRIFILNPKPDKDKINDFSGRKCQALKQLHDWLRFFVDHENYYYYPEKRKTRVSYERREKHEK